MLETLLRSLRKLVNFFCGNQSHKLRRFFFPSPPRKNHPDFFFFWLVTKSSHFSSSLEVFSLIKFFFFGVKKNIRKTIKKSFKIENHRKTFARTFFFSNREKVCQVEPHQQEIFQIFFETLSFFFPFVSFSVHQNWGNYTGNYTKQPPVQYNYCYKVFYSSQVTVQFTVIDLL